jgi:hypothetical protein
VRGRDRCIKNMFGQKSHFVSFGLIRGILPINRVNLRLYRKLSNLTNLKVVKPKLEQKSKLFEYYLSNLKHFHRTLNILFNQLTQFFHTISILLNSNIYYLVPSENFVFLIFSFHLIMVQRATNCSKYILCSKRYLP